MCKTDYNSVSLDDDLHQKYTCQDKIMIAIFSIIIIGTILQGIWFTTQVYALSEMIRLGSPILSDFQVINPRFILSIKQDLHNISMSLQQIQRVF